MAASTNSRAFIGFDSFVSPGALAGTLAADVAGLLALTAGSGATGPRAIKLNKTRSMNRSRIASYAGLTHL